MARPDRSNGSRCAGAILRLRLGWPVVLGLAWGAVLAPPLACVPAAERPSGHHPASAEASAAPLPEAAAALGPRYAVDAGAALPAILEDEPGPARLPGVGIAPSRPLVTDAGAEGHHAH